MTPQRKAAIEARWRAIDKELADIADGRVVADDPGASDAASVGYWPGFLS